MNPQPLAQPAILVDTSVLLRLHKRHGGYDAVRRFVEERRRVGAHLCVTPQILAELWNVSTRPIEQNGFGLTVEETDADLREVEAEFTLLPDQPEILGYGANFWSAIRSGVRKSTTLASWRP